MRPLKALQFNSLLRFRLRPLLLLPIAVGIVCLSPPVQQFTTVRAIRRAGGGVGTSGVELNGVNRVLAQWVPDAFEEIDVLNLADVPVQRGWLPTIKRSDRLATLWLNRSGVADEDLGVLGGKQKLWELYLNGNPITDAGLKNLGRLPLLERLQLNNTNVRNPGIVADSMPKVWVLKLRGTAVTDAAVSEIVRMPSLRQIDLSRTQITDLALEYLATVKTLDLVEIQDTPTSESGAQTLHTALAPHCTVYAADGSCLVADRYRQ